MSATKVLNKKLCRNKKIKKNSFEFTPTSNSSAGSKCMKGDNDSELTKSNYMPNLNLDFDDNLELEEISGQDNNSELMFPYDVNKRLSDQVQTLLRENAVLQKSLIENEARLRGVQKYPPAMAMHGRASDLAASKIVELTKRVRELTADLEVAKLKCKNAVMLSIKPTSETTNEETNENFKEKNVDKTNELKELRDKLTNTNLKLCEIRNQCQQLKHELKISHKALANEVGDNVPLQNVLNGGTWRGRAQIIFTLQQQVAELTEKLNNSDFKEKQINVNKSAIRQIEKDLKAENAKEIMFYKDQLEEKLRKLDAFKARNKVLEIQVAELRGQVTILLEKTTHDDELISSLTVQLRVALEKKEQDANSKKEFQHRSLERELSLEKQRASQFQCALSDREDKIALLEEKIRELQNKLERKTPEKVESRSKSVEAPAVDTVGIAGEAEKTRLLELLSVTSKRLSQERHDVDKIQEMLRKERQKSAKLETKLARLELERSSGRCYSHNAASSKIVESVPQEVKYKLELLEEENLYLKTRLNSVQLEKEDDLRNYTILLEDTRRTFLDSVRSIKTEKE